MLKNYGYILRKHSNNSWEKKILKLWAFLSFVKKKSFLNKHCIICITCGRDARNVYHQKRCVMRNLVGSRKKLCAFDYDRTLQNAYWTFVHMWFHKFDDVFSMVCFILCVFDTTGRYVLLMQAQNRIIWIDTLDQQIYQDMILS